MDILQANFEGDLLPGSELIESMHQVEDEDSEHSEQEDDEEEDLILAPNVSSGQFSKQELDALLETLDLRHRKLLKADWHVKGMFEARSWAFQDTLGVLTELFRTPCAVQSEAVRTQFFRDVVRRVRRTHKFLVDISSFRKAKADFKTAAMIKRRRIPTEAHDNSWTSWCRNRAVAPPMRELLSANAPRTMLPVLIQYLPHGGSLILNSWRREAEEVLLAFTEDPRLETDDGRMTYAVSARRRAGDTLNSIAWTLEHAKIDQKPCKGQKLWDANSYPLSTNMSDIAALSAAINDDTVRAVGYLAPIGVLVIHNFSKASYQYAVTHSNLTGQKVWRRDRLLAAHGTSL